MPNGLCVRYRGCVETKNLEAWKTGKEKQRCNVGWANGVKKYLFGTSWVEDTTWICWRAIYFFNWVRKNATKLKFIGCVFVGEFCFTDFTVVNPPWKKPPIWENILVGFFRNIEQANPRQDAQWGLVYKQSIHPKLPSFVVKYTRENWVFGKGTYCTKTASYFSHITFTRCL